MAIDAQVADEDATFSFAIPDTAFADADTATLTLTATLADGTDLPGWLSFDGTSLSGEPTQADVGALSVLVTATDGTNAPATTLFDLTVAEVNDAPVVTVVDAGLVGEAGDPVVIDLLEGATDEEGDPLTVNVVSAKDADGSDVIVGAVVDGTITIDPAQFADTLSGTETAEVTVTYTVSDGTNAPVENTATLTVTGEDPVRDWFIDRDGDGFGSDLETDPIITQVDQPDGFVDNDRDFDDNDASVNPEADEINDGKDNDQDGFVDEDNVDPVAADDAFATGAGRTLLLSSDELTANDTDADGDVSLEVTGVTSGTGGLAEYDPDTRIVTFTPEAGFTGPATFTYEMTDGFGGSSVATVTVDVEGDDAGVTETDLILNPGAISGFTSQDRPRESTVTATEGENDITLQGNTWKKVDLIQPINIGPATELVFTLRSDLIGEIVGIGFDNGASSLAGRPLFQLGGTQRLPTLLDQTYATYETGDGDQEYRIDLSGLDGQSFDNIVFINDQDRGDLNANAVFTDVRIVTTAAPGNTPPTAGDDSASMSNAEPLVINESALLLNDADADGDALSIVRTLNVQNGTLERENGQITFTADTGFTGEARFDYEVSDGNGGSAVASVLIDVQESNLGERISRIDFTANPFVSYSGQDRTADGATVSDGGSTVTLSGNTWKTTLLTDGDYTITEDTILRFDFTMDAQAELAGIGLEGDNAITTSDDIVFQLAGSQTYNFLDQSFRDEYTVLGDTVSYAIDLGDFAGQTFSRLALVDDKDNGADGIVRFSNVELVEPGVVVDGNPKPPVIVGGTLPPWTVNEDAPIEIDLPFLDPDTDFDDLSFIFSGLPDFLSFDGRALIGAAGNDEVGAYTIGVTAQDPEGNSVAGSFDLTVNNVNDAPDVNGSIPNARGVIGQEFALDLPAGLFTDVDAGDSLTFRAEGLPDGFSIDGNTGRITGTPTATNDFEIEVFAADQAGAEVSVTFDLFVADTILRDAVEIEFEDFTGLTEAGSDLQNFFTSFAGPASGREVVRVNGRDEGTISTDLAAAGVVGGLYDLTIQFFDENDGNSQLEVFTELDGVLSSIGTFAMDQVLPGQGSSTQAANVTTATLSGVTIPDGARLVITGQADRGEILRLDKVSFTPIENSRPDISSPEAFSVEENSTAAAQIVATDGENDPLTYEITGGADAERFAIDQTGALTFRDVPDFEAPLDAGGDNVYDVRITVSDGQSLRSQSLAITVTDGNEPPVITSAATADAVENQLDVATVTATDADAGGTAIVFGLDPAVADNALFAIDPGTGVLTFNAAPDFETPADADADGVYDVQVSASSDGATATQDLAVTVTDANDAPVATTPVPAQSATITAASTIAASALFTDADGDDLTLTSVSGGPDGLSIVDGALSGTATETGSFSVTVEATDGIETVSTTFALEVTEEVGPFGAVAPNQNLDGDGFVNALDDDVDGDGVANVDDAFSYDAADGVLLAEGEAIDLNFDQDGTPYQNGFTGLLQAATGAGNTFKAFDEETGAASVANGLLTVATTTGDTGGQNTPQDDYQLGIKNGDFTVEGRVLNPFVTDGPTSFDQLGLHVGVDSTDFAKFVFGGSIEFSSRIDDAEAKATGGNQPYPAGLTPATFSAVDISLVVNSIDAGSATVTAFGTFLDAAGEAIAGATDTNFGTLAISGAMAAALADETVAVGTGFTQVHAGSSSSFDAQLDSFKVTPNADVVVDEPATAEEVFAAQLDLDTAASYGANVVGSAVLTVNGGNNSIETSNFSANSFQVTNTGDKKIAAVFIDARSALYQDSVFDPDGAGGDSTAKLWAINSAGDTGGFIGGGVGGYFLPGQDPLPNETGIGAASNGGYKGALVKFNGDVAGGFENDETVGFSGDMDPNSIAGLTKGIVDGTAIDSWDVGGISGHELIGSVFTVLFDDGSTATGQLASDKSASGSAALATQNASVTAPTLTVNGVAEGGLGTYGGTTPSVIVTGTPGDVVRVTLTKGFNPVTETTGGVAQLVEDRLARYDFKANNNFDSQSVDVTLDASGTFDASILFDYDDAIANNKMDGTFAGDDVAQIGFVASVIDPANGGLTISATTAPIYLTNEGGPVAGDPELPAPDGYFAAVNAGSANAYFKIQIEDENGTGGTSPGGKWNYLTSGDELGNQDGFQGSGYYLFGANTSTGIDNNVGGNELLEYTVFIDGDDLGTWNFNFAVSRDGVADGDQQNDLWLNFKPAQQAGNGDIEDYLIHAATTEAEPVNSGYVKVFGGPNNGTWGEADAVDGDPGNFNAAVEITEAGLYTIQIDGRSQGYHVDYLELSKGGSNPGSGAANSQFIEGDPNAPKLIQEIGIGSTSDDWEQFGGAGSADLEFGLNGSATQAVGLRFDGIDLPAGATIKNAYLEFTAFEDSSGAANFTIGIEDDTDAATFSAGSPPEDRTTADEFVWSNAEIGQWEDGGVYTTPDISELIETLVDGDEIDDGAFAFVIEGSGSRVAESFGNGEAPRLIIEIEDNTLLG